MFLRAFALVSLALALPGPGSTVEILPVARFSAHPPGGELPPAWQPLTFSGIDAHTAYSLVDEGGTVVVRAESQASASGLMREIEVDPALHPILEWRWRVANVLENGDVSRKSGDDYAARIYVTFGYDPSQAGLFERARYEALRLIHGRYPPVAALNYIWESRSPVGTIVPNPYVARNRMIVVESGDQNVGTWRLERRNVALDYERAFGGEAPRISGVAIMTDTDDTGESATAWFGDISFRAAPGS